MVQAPPKVTKDLQAYKWALPESLNVPADELKVRLDFYQDTIILYTLAKGVIKTKQVSAQDISMAILSEISLSSGILPASAIWWKQTSCGAEVALWRAPKIWAVALQAEPFKPALRFDLPMPGLIFLCSPGKPPSVYAAKRRPKALGENIYHAPLYNVYESGNTCPGSQKYPQDMDKIPETFFTAFFTPAASPGGRSKKYPDDLRKLWETIDGQKRYPMQDLVKMGTVADLIKQ